MLTTLLGLLLRFACAADDTWDVKTIDTQQVGVNAVSWEPATGAETLSPKRLVTAGCDNTIKIWGFDEAAQSWSEQAKLEEHVDWVRDVAWAPNMCMPNATIASCSQDQTVKIWCAVSWPRSPASRATRPAEPARPARQESARQQAETLLVPANARMPAFERQASINLSVEGR